MEEKVIIQVGLSNAEYVAKANETIKKMDELKLQQFQLKAAGQQGSVQWLANAQALKGLQSELKSYTTLAAAASTAEKALADSAENARLAYTSETGSINELRARLSVLTAQRNAMSAADRDGTEAGRQLTAETRSLSDQLKVLEKSAGDTRRNVGNYTDSIIAAFENTVPFGNQMVGVARQAQALSGGIGEGSAALRIFRVALASTGIGLIIVAIAALINYLKNLKPVMDFIEVAASGLKAGFEVLGRIVFDLGKALVDAFSNPLELIKDVGRFLANPIQGFKNLGNAAAEAGKQMAAAAREAAELQRRVQDQDDADRAAISTLARLRLERDKYAVQAKNISLSESQRNALLEKSIQREKEASKIELDNAKARLSNLQEEERQFKKRNKAQEASDDLLDKIANAEAEVYQLQAASLKFTEKRYNDQAKLQEKAEAAAQKAAEAEQKRLEKLQEANDALLASQNAALATTRTNRQNELADIEADIAARKKQFENYGATTVALENERIARIKALNDQYRKEDQEAARAYLEAIEDEQIARIVNADDRELAQIAIKNQRKIDSQQRLIDETNDRIAKGETGLTEILLSQELLRDELMTTQRFELAQKNEKIEEEIRMRNMERMQQELEFSQAISAARIKVKEEELDILSNAADVASGIFKKESTAAKAAFVVEKGVAIARVVIKTQEALAANRAAEQLANVSYAAMGIFGIGASIANSIKAAAERTRIIVSGAISGAAIVAQSIAGFKDGVIGFDSDGRGSMVYGQGTGRSDSINARLSHGESVINAESTRMFAPLLSAINQAGGGRALTRDYSGSAFAYGGIFNGQNLRESAGIVADIENSIREGMKGVRVEVDVRNVTRAQQENIEVEVRRTI